MNCVKNKIIVEGFWNMGKTSLIKKLSKEFGHKIICEPNHIEEDITSETEKWYIQQHQKNLKKFFSHPKQKNILERSILSSTAFLYATNKFSSKNKKILFDFASSYKNFKPLIIFLYAEDSKIKLVSKSAKDTKVKNLLAKKEFRKKYDFFFRNILPFEFGITPVFINIQRNDHLKNTNDIKKCVEKITKENRIAQINLICYKIIKEEPCFLLLKRNWQKGNFWQCITGGIKTGETINNALKRELQEEISINPKRNFSPANYSFNYVGGENYELNEYVFGYKLNAKDKIILSKEHIEYKFMSFKKCISMLKYKSNRTAVQKVYFSIKNKKKIIHFL
jgi:dATP pyrophosphohydrolase